MSKFNVIELETIKGHLEPKIIGQVEANDLYEAWNKAVALHPELARFGKLQVRTINP